MPNRDIKETRKVDGQEVDSRLFNKAGRRVVGEASPEIRKRLLAEKLKGGRSEGPGEKEPDNDADDKTTRGNLRSGASKLFTPKKNIETAINKEIQ